MNARAVETAIPEFIFGDPRLHGRFSMAIELLARIILATPASVTTASLAEAIRQPARSVRVLLANLRRAGLLAQDDEARDTWRCASSLTTITLADVFRCVAAAAQASRRRKKPAAPTDESRSSAQQGADLLLMQATMSINQVVLQHLQAFDLGRLKAMRAAGGMHHVSAPRSYVAEPA